MKAYLEQAEIEKLELAAEFLRDKIIIRLLWRLGCRISEVLGITVDNIDFNQGTITIEHLKARIKLSCPQCSTRLGKMHKFCPVCGAKVEQAVAQEQEHHRYRSLPVDNETQALLREYINRGGSVPKRGKRLLFSLSRHRAWQIIKECAEKAGLPRLVNVETGKEHNVSPHKLRDAFAVHAVKLNDSGDGLRLLQEHLGHHNITTTMKYRKISGEEQKEWYEKLWQGGKENG
jgi:integrase/recombinase XerD